MPEFRAPNIGDKKRVDEILSKADFEGSFYSFAAIFTWALKYQTKIAFHNDALLISGYSDSLGHYFLYPVGQFDLAEVFGIMKEEARKLNCELKIVAETYQAKKLYNEFFGEFQLEDSRDDWDYVYNSGDLANLRGNRYHGKRNHISRLTKKLVGHEFSFETLTAENASECMEIERQWVQDKGDDFDMESVERSLFNLDELGLSGGVLRLDGKAIAFTVGEPLLEDTFIIHIEKALSGYDGAYQMINQLFAKTVANKYQYINREEDMGIEGLRNAKLSYLPCKMIEKCVITERK